MPILVHLGKSATISKLTVLFFIISILIVFPGTYYFGIYGLVIGLSISNFIASIIYMHTCQKNLKLDWDFKLIIKIYLYFILTTFLIIILREIELFYTIRLIIKLGFLSIFVFYIHYNKIIDFKTYYNEIQNKINKAIYIKPN